MTVNIDKYTYYYLLLINVPNCKRAHVQMGKVQNFSLTEKNVTVVKMDGGNQARTAQSYSQKEKHHPVKYTPAVALHLPIDLILMFRELMLVYNKY